MLEILVALVLVVAAMVALGSREQRLAWNGPARTPLLPAEDGASPDLPCPWCLAPTREDDPSCPSCGQRFG